MNWINEKTDANAEMTEMLQLSNKGFKAGIKKYFNEQLGTLLKQMEKEQSQQRHRPIKEKPNENFRTAKYIKWNRMLSGWAQQQNWGYEGNNQ